MLVEDLIRTASFRGRSEYSRNNLGEDAYSDLSEIKSLIDKYL